MINNDPNDRIDNTSDSLTIEEIYKLVRENLNEAEISEEEIKKLVETYLIEKEMIIS